LIKLKVKYPNLRNPSRINQLLIDKRKDEEFKVKFEKIMKKIEKGGF